MFRRNAVPSIAGLSLALLSACSPPAPGGSNSPPLIGNPPGDQTVVRNTLDPKRVEVAFEVSDADGDPITVHATSSDQGVVTDGDLAPSCDPQGRCTLAFTPNPEQSARVVITLRADDESGEQHVSARSRAAFTIDVTGRLVSSGLDFGAGSLRQTVLDAEAGDVIGFAPEPFDGAVTISLREQIVLDKTLTIDGPGAESLTLDGNGLVRIFRIDGSADVRLRGLTLEQGYAPRENFPTPDGIAALQIGGAALVVGGARLTLESCTVTGSVAAGPSGFGGGLGTVEGTIVLGDGTLVTGNGAANGGGGIAAIGLDATESVIRVDGATITGNGTFGAGGGIAGVNGDLVVRRGSVVSGNAAGWGGGIFSSGSLTLRDSRIEANEALHDGGGILNTGQLTITESAPGGAGAASATIVRDNEADRGGGIYNSGSLSLGAGTEVGDNRARGPAPSGGGIYNIGTLSGSGTVTGNTPDQTAP